MDTANISKEEMKYLIDKYSGENIDKLFSTGLLTHPMAASGPRQHLFSVHYTQHVMLNNPETPRCFTGWEKQFGKYLNSFYKADKNYEIINKIVRHSSFPEMGYVLVVREVGTNNYNTIRVNHYEKLSDKHGYLKPFTHMDNKVPGSLISKNDIVYKATSLDEFGNYRYGVNAKVAYMLIPEVIEDSLVVSESFAKKISFNLITKTEYVINKNDILLNIYGNGNEYKCFPNVGENINDKGILFATRKIDKSNISADFTDQALMNLYYTDNKFGSNGRVIDIDIKINDVEELTVDSHRDQLYYIYNDQFRFNQELVDVLQPIVNDPMNHVTTQLEQTLFNARNYISPNIKYSCNTGNFEFAHITIYTVDEQCLTSAMKMTNRCGGKAVIGQIWPDEYMPIDANGVRCEVICSSAGIVGRTNPAQLFEQTINYISDEILRRMQKCKTIDESINLMVEYLSMISPEWGEYTKTYYASKNKKEKELLLENLYKSGTGIYVYAPPANNAIGWQLLKKVAKKYKIKVSKVKMCKSYQVSDEVANMYDLSDNIELVKQITKDYTFDGKMNTKKDKKTKKVIKEFKTRDFTVNDLFDAKPNQLKLSKKDYEANKWIDDYTWSENEMGINDLLDDDTNPSDLVDYINNMQALEGEFDSETFLESQMSEKHSSFNTTKSRVFRKGPNLLIRESISKHNIIIADVYMFLLKQLPQDAFSARSLGSITPTGLPNKTGKKSEIGKPYGDTCNQMSDMDNVDMKNLVDPKIVNRFYSTQSTNPTLRSELARELLFGDPTEAPQLPYTNDEIKDSIPSRMLSSYLSALGLEIADSDDPDPYEFLDNIDYTTVSKLFEKTDLKPKN